MFVTKKKKKKKKNLCGKKKRRRRQSSSSSSKRPRNNKEDEDDDEDDDARRDGARILFRRCVFVVVVARWERVFTADDDRERSTRRIFRILAPVVPCSCDQQTNNDRVWNVSCRAAFASGDERRRKSFYTNFRRNRSQRRSRSSGASPPKTTTTRVSETRVYYPGQTYEPSELEGSFASAAPSASQKTRRVLKKGKDLDALVARSIDWKDMKTLSTRFVSETGKILPRRQTD